MADRPLLLDLFCGAGGAATGYYRAGFDVLGVDIKPQKRYPFAFSQDDAMSVLARLAKGKVWRAADGRRFRRRDFAVIHASPPCQRYSAASNIHGGDHHPDLVVPVRELLIASDRTYVIENVPRSPLRMAVNICGLALGLNVKRHRWFESNILLFGTECGDHSKDYLIVFGGGARGRAHQIGRTKKGGPIIHRPTISVERAREAMGIDWMTRDELSQAVPPKYTEFLGKQLLAALRSKT